MIDWPRRIRDGTGIGLVLDHRGHPSGVRREHHYDNGHRWRRPRHAAGYRDPPECAARPVPRHHASLAGDRFSRFGDSLDFSRLHHNQRNRQRQRGRGHGDLGDQYRLLGHGQRHHELVRLGSPAGGIEHGDHPGVGCGWKYVVAERGRHAVLAEAMLYWSRLSRVVCA